MLFALWLEVIGDGMSATVVAGCGHSMERMTPTDQKVGGSNPSGRAIAAGQTTFR